jgi:YhgE/Pip-like protein
MPTAPQQPDTTSPDGAAALPLRARTVLRVPVVWIFPLCIPAVLIMLMTFIYVGSVLNPVAHLHGLPVMVVNQDRGATIGGRHLDEGEAVVRALTGTAAVSSRLGLHEVSMQQAETVMNRGGAYATVVIPSTFTDSLLGATGAVPPSTSSPPAQPAVQLLENERAGTLGVSLAAGVLTPALHAISTHVGADLVKQSTAAARATAFSTAQLRDPIALTTSSYRPLPANTALGLSAFYMSLLAMLAGFVGATIINSSLDGALGYATTELGPRWKQRRPLPIERRQTLFLKWTVALVAIPVLTATIVGVAAGILRMDAPHTFLLWAVLTLAALMVAFSTLTLFAAFGSIGQLLAMLSLVYLSLASSGGTVPTQALPGFYNFVGHIEPLRQVLTAARAVLYFGAQADAGLTHAAVVLAAELLAAVVVGVVITTWYDRRGLYRLSPEMIAYVGRVADARLASAPPAITGSTTSS